MNAIQAIDLHQYYRAKPVFSGVVLKTIKKLQKIDFHLPQALYFKG